MKPHKWAKEIHAWADGAEIEGRNDYGNTKGDWHTLHDPTFLSNTVEYRIKPQPKEPQHKEEDRFDMEQKIINFGSILDDLKLVNDYIGDDRIDALIKLYQLKYDDLWNCFEKVIENGTT